MRELARILMLKNEFEAALLEEILKDKGIPHIIKSYHDSVYDGLWQTPTGWGQVEAPESYRDEIISIYNNLSAS